MSDFTSHKAEYESLAEGFPKFEKKVPSTAIRFFVAAMLVKNLSIIGCLVTAYTWNHFTDIQNPRLLLALKYSGFGMAATLGFDLLMAFLTLSREGRLLDLMKARALDVRAWYRVTSFVLGLAFTACFIGCFLGGSLN